MVFGVLKVRVSLWIVRTKKHSKTIVKCMKVIYNIHIERNVYDYSIMEVWKWTKMFRTIM